MKVRSVDLTNSRVLLDTRCGGLRNAYSATGKSQVVRVPQVGNLTIPAAPASWPFAVGWAKGGIVALRLETSWSTAPLMRVVRFPRWQRSDGSSVQTDESPDRPAGYRIDAGFSGRPKAKGSPVFCRLYDALGGAFGRGAPANSNGGEQTSKRWRWRCNGGRFWRMTAAVS